MGDDLGGHVPGPAVKISRIRHSAPLRATAQARIMISLPRVECQQRTRDAVLCQSPPPAPSQCGRILRTHRGQTMKRGLTAFRRSAEDAWRRERRQHQGLRPTGRPLPGSQPGTRRADPRLREDLPAGPQLHRRHHQRTVCPPRPARTVAAWAGHLPARAISSPTARRSSNDQVLTTCHAELSASLALDSA